MTEEDYGQRQLHVNAKHLRFRVVNSAIALGLTLVNLAQAERVIGNRDRANRAADNAMMVHQRVMDCLSANEFTAEEKQEALKNLNELEKALGSRTNSPSP